jgi:2-haloacid dehalogenase
VLWVFDLNETMLDLSPLDAVFQRLVGSPDARREWFDLLIRSVLVATAAGQYRDFSGLGATCAEAVARAHGRELNGWEIAELATAMRELPAHPEVPAALEALREMGHRLVALGNSPQVVVDAQLENSGLALVLDAAYSAERAQALKPAPAPYRMVLDAEQAAPDQAVMVAAHDWDVAGAQAAGMRAVFIARPGARPPLPAWPEPDLVAADLAEAADSGLAIQWRQR